MEPGIPLLRANDHEFVICSVFQKTLPKHHKSELLSTSKTAGDQRIAIVIKWMNMLEIVDVSIKDS